MRECSDRAVPLLNSVTRSPTDKVLFEILSLERVLQSELEAIKGLVSAIDEPQSDSDLMSHMCLSRHLALERTVGGNAGAGAAHRDLALERDAQGGLGIGYSRSSDTAFHYSINNLIEGRPGHSFGLQVGDVVLRVDGHETSPLTGICICMFTCVCRC